MLEPHPSPTARPLAAVLAALLLASCGTLGKDKDPRHFVRVAYAYEGDLFWVRADGSGNARLRACLPKPVESSEEGKPAAPVLFDAWFDAQMNHNQPLVAAIRVTNHVFDEEKLDVGEAERRFEVVLVRPGTPPAEDLVLFSTKNRIRGLCWSPEGDRLLFREHDLRLLIWSAVDDTVRQVMIADDPVLERRSGSWFAAGWMPEWGWIAVAFRPRQQTYPPVLYLGTISLNEQPAVYSPAGPWFRQTDRIARASRNLGHLLSAILGPNPKATFAAPSLYFTPDNRFSFRVQGSSEWIPRYWIEGVDHTTGEVYDVVSLPRPKRSDLSRE